ncbi:MAG: hypothetical protein EON85_08035 [Brevundimonas sp.]|nr:MAG: hypothetical protein EON85_08035 [Brevundimonas sp.]
MTSSLSAASLNRRALIASLIGGGALTAACSSRVDGYRFRIDFRLIDNGVHKHARTVRSAEWRRQSLLAGEGPFLRGRGSAAAIDLDAGRTVFLTLGGYYNWNGSRMSFYGDGERKWEHGGLWTPEQFQVDRNIAGERIDGRVQMNRDRDVIHVFAPHELPVLATFNDPDNPGSGRVIRPDDLASEFPGVVLGRSTFQFTHERVTRGDVHRRLPWLSEREPYKTGWRSLDPHLFVA